jgi:hypothetical protein
MNRGSLRQLIVPFFAKSKKATIILYCYHGQELVVQNQAKVNRNKKKYLNSPASQA